LEARGAVEVRVPRELWPRSGGWRGRLVWAAPPGSRVERGQVVAEVEIEKAVLEIESPVGGVVVWSLPEGSEVGPGSVVVRVEPGGGGG